MINHHLTLYHVVKELSRLINLPVVECFTQEKDNLMIGLYNGDDLNYIQINTGNTDSCIFFRDNFSRAGKNSVDLFPEIIGKTLIDISLIPNERIIKLYFGDYRLMVHLFGAGKSNVYAVNSENKISDAFLSGSKYIDKIYSLPDTTLKVISEMDIDSTVFKAIATSNFLLGKYYSAQLLKDLNIDKNILIKELSPEKLKIIKKEAENFKNKCLETDKFYLLKKDDNLPLLSLCPLDDFPDLIETFDSISKSIRRRIYLSIKINIFENQYKAIEKKLTLLSSKLNRNIDEINKNSENVGKEEIYKLWGELLISHPNNKVKHGKVISLKSWEGNLVEIPLDEKLTLLENGQKYFDKSKNAKLNKLKRIEQLPRLELKLKITYEILKRLEEANNIKDLEKIKQSMKEDLNIFDELSINEPAAKFRVFELGEGYVLYVGKNAANNDELTMKYARPNDLWLHARGTSGSHAVLRLEKNQKPPKNILLKAASIVAYYSGAKNAKYVPVAYTYRKYVHKPKGSNPGSVVIQREEVIMAEPGLPDSLNTI